LCCGNRYAVVEENFVRGKSSANLIAAAREIFAQEPHVRIDYIEIVIRTGLIS